MRRQKPLGGVRQSFAGTVDSGAIGRDQSIALCEAGGRGQSRHACGGGETCSEELAARNFSHVFSWGKVARPVIMARMRLLNPARTTIAMWTMRKSRRNAETKK